MLTSSQVLTTSWSDGSPGPIGFSVPDGTMSPSEMQAWNVAHKGHSWVMSSGSGTHFMTAEVWMVMLEQMVSPALQIQRAKHLNRDSCVYFSVVAACIVLFPLVSGSSSQIFFY